MFVLYTHVWCTLQRSACLHTIYTPMCVQHRHSVCSLMLSEKLSLQGAIFTLDMSEDGYSTGGKDGTVRLWDPDFKPVTSVNLSNSPVGYKGRLDEQLQV